MHIPETVIDALNEFGVLKFEAPLRNYTSFETGGPADLLISPNGKDDISSIVKISNAEGIPLTVIGGGSNLLIGDRGIAGIVIRLCSDDSRNGEIRMNSDGTVYADAIVKKEGFINYSVDSGRGGVEFMAGIPGCIGGGIVMNAGTDIGTFVDILTSVNIIDESGEPHKLEITGKISSYRKMELGKNAIVTGGYFNLPEEETAENVRERIVQILAERREKHPADFPSAGSVFKNPDGYSSWRLIQDAGLKGERIGGAAVSDLHTNFIINVENASSRDVKNLIEHIQGKVYEKYKIELETEIRMIGNFEQ